MNSSDSSYATILRFNRESEDELLLEGSSMPLESIRSCELAVECWNLRSSLAEADQSFHYTKDDLKVQKYTLRRVQDEMILLRRAMAVKDKRLKQQSDVIDRLKTQNDRSESSRHCIINSISKTEHARKVTVQKYLQLEIENRTIISQIAAQEMAWQEKYTTMELLLTLDAQQAEKERDGLVARLNFVNKALDNASSELHSIKNQTQNMAQKNKEQEIRIAQLEDKCAWGRELEQAYESLHGLLEISDADKKAALLRISQLEQERMRVYEYAINEGLQLPSSLCADND